MRQNFRDSQEYVFRRLIRDAVKRGDFTKHERDVVLAVMNHWLHHKGGPKRYIHPSRESLAQKAQCSIKTVSRCMAMLRAAGAIIAVSPLRAGKGQSVRYTVNLHAFFALCGMDWMDEFARYRAPNVPLTKPKMSHYDRDAMSHCLNDVWLGFLPKGTFLPIADSLIDYDDVEFPLGGDDE